MAFLARFRVRLHSTLSRSFSILSPDSTPLTSRQKARTALSLIKSEKNPYRIIDICREVSLTPQYHLDRLVFSLAINKLSESRSFDAIRSFLDELKTRADLKTEQYFSHAIVLYGQAGMLDHAIRTFKEMENVKIERTVRSLNKLLFACIIAKKHDEVFRIFREFPKIYDITPDIETYNTVVKSLCETGSSDTAHSLLNEMFNISKPNAATYNTLIAGFYREGKFEDVYRILDLMEKNGCHAGVSTFNIRIQSLCKLKKSDEAESLFKEMISKGIEPNTVTYSHLIYGFCKEIQLDKAKKMFKEMLSKGLVVNSHCYYTLIYYLCQGRDFDSALTFCKESMEKKWIPCFSTMKALVNGLVSNSKSDEAIELVSQMKEKFSGKSDMWLPIEESLSQS